MATTKPKKFTLSHLEVLELALKGVTIKVGSLARDTTATYQDLSWHIRAQAELERRIKIMKSSEEKHS